MNKPHTGVGEVWILYVNTVANKEKQKKKPDCLVLYLLYQQLNEQSIFWDWQQHTRIETVSERYVVISVWKFQWINQVWHAFNTIFTYNRILSKVCFCIFFTEVDCLWRKEHLSFLFIQEIKNLQFWSIITGFLPTK